MKTLYETRATAKAGRQGQVSTDDGLLDVALAYPKAMGGSGLATNPEQLLPQVTRPVSLMRSYTLLKSVKLILRKPLLVPL